MNHLNRLARADYRPDLALIVYRANENEDVADNWAEYYIESHSINEDGQLMEGKPLQAETIAGMVEVFRDRNQQETKISGAIPSCLLHFSPGTSGDYRMIWYRPAVQKVLYFTDDLKLKSGTAFVPPMLWVASAADLSVWALSNGKRPAGKSKLLHAPFHNVDSGGRVCLGSAKVKQPATKSFENLIAYWEEIFWASKFSHSHNDAAATGGLQKLWRAQLRRPDQPFPMNVLNETKTTFQQLINGR